MFDHKLLEAMYDGISDRNSTIQKLDCSVARNRKCIPRSP